ncbi:MAG TPA: glycosyl transferase family 2 [Chitinophagaceae bacterium]|nr:glycosyl transferase family 2 [Chitinophagaceae bacterium]HAN39686.1 glycosyl transferase family 2 [Chitinophagaceae bacterium]
MISVVIPALNEENTITHVVTLALQTPQVTEVIVVDDKSLDNTANLAVNAGAKVITSTKLGKGASMKDGVLYAQNEVIVFLDADITTYSSDTVTKLATPILNNEADFVKSYFTRQAGRVTALVAKPLLHIINPSFPPFEQPLSGMVAGRKSMLEKCDFEDGYGVDIGLLIDMYHANAVIQEVNIGTIENRMQPLEQLGKMSLEVARTILKKSKDKNFQNLETYEDIQVIRDQMEYAIKEQLLHLKKIAVFDMDNTILRNSFIQTATKVFGCNEQLLHIVTNSDNPFIRTKQIAQLLKGKNIGELTHIADSITVTPGLEALIQVLKQQGYIIGIISDSYNCITNHIKNKFGFDFTIANELEFSKSVATGEVKIPSFFLNNEQSMCKHDYCKLNALISVCNRYHVDIKNTIYIGDGENDICCVKKAGIGIAFCATHHTLDIVADYVIKEPDFTYVIPTLQ